MPADPDSEVPHNHSYPSHDELSRPSQASSVSWLQAYYFNRGQVLRLYKKANGSASATFGTRKRLREERDNAIARRMICADARVLNGALRGFSYLTAPCRARDFLHAGGHPGVREPRDFQLLYIAAFSMEPWPSLKHGAGSRGSA